MNLDEAFEDDTLSFEKKGPAKQIPFGSTLNTRPLRVSLDQGAVLVMTPDGKPMGLNHLPNWEQAELIRHVVSAIEAGAL